MPSNKRVEPARLTVNVLASVGSRAAHAQRWADDGVGPHNEPSWRRMIVSLTRPWLATAGALLLLAAPLAEGQTAMVDKVARVGLLLYTDSLDKAPKLAAAFREGLRERGWVEGRNLVIEERWAEGKKERLAKLATQLVRLKVDVIVAPTPWATVAAKTATATIPVVMIVVDDPVQAKLVASLARPGGNVTGLTAAVGAADIIGKQLELTHAKRPESLPRDAVEGPNAPLRRLRLRRSRESSSVVAGTASNGRRPWSRRL
jgi:ABC transporter substrate binding protein